MLVAPICHLELKCLGLCFICACWPVWRHLASSDFVIPKFQVTTIIESRTLKNCWRSQKKFSSAGFCFWGFVLRLFCLCLYNSLNLFLFFCCSCFSFVCFLFFYVDFLFLFIHHGSVTFYLDLVAWFLNFLGELNQSRSVLLSKLLWAN